MSERKQVIAPSGIGSAEAFGRIGIITEKRFWEWNWPMLCAMVLANIISILTGALISLFIPSHLGVGLGIGLAIVFSIIVFCLGLRAVARRTIREIYK